MIWLKALSLSTTLAFATPAEDRTLIGQLDREVIALRQKIEVLNQRLATCSTGDELDPLFTELKTALDGQHVVVSRSGPHTLVTVPLDELFVNDGARVREEADPIVDLLATAMKLHPASRVTILAYADSEPVSAALRKQAPTAWELTAWRAALVTRLFTERFSVPPSQLTAAGRGAQDPVASNDTPEGRFLNRRLVLLFEPGVPP